MLPLWNGLVLVLVHGATMAASLPMIRRRIAPNPLYGFRTPKTLSNERVWYEANAVSGRWLFGMTALSGVVALPLFAVFPGETALVASLSVFTGAVLVAAAASFVALARM